MTGPAAPPLRFSHLSGLNAVVKSLDGVHRMLVSPSAEGVLPVRLTVANLVAACTEPTRADHALGVLATITEQHPSRVIIVLADPVLEPLIEAEVSFRCATGTQRICAEIVRLVVHGEPAYHLSTIVTPLLVPDIPLHLWLVGAPRLQQAFLPDTVAMCERIVLDSGRYEEAATTLAQLAEELRRHGDQLSIGDVAWERTEVWREIIAQAFDSASTRPWLHRVSAVDIRTSGEHVSSQAWLVAGWLSSRLGWTDKGHPELHVAPVATDAILAGDLVELRIRCGQAGRGMTLSVRRIGTVLHTSLQIDPGEAVSRELVMPPLNDVDVIGGLMAESGDDPIYDVAVAAAAELAATPGR